MVDSPRGHKGSDTTERLSLAGQKITHTRGRDELAWGNSGALAPRQGLRLHLSTPFHVYPPDHLQHEGPGQSEGCGSWGGLE